MGILLAGVTAAAVLLWENIDIRQLVPRLAASPAPLPIPEAPSPAAVDSARFDAVLFNSERNRDYFPDSTYYTSELRRWREAIGSVGGTIRDAATADELRTLDTEDVLVLVEAPCVSEEEMDRVREHLRRGGSVVSNWATGARDRDCEWVGWQAVAELTGADDVRELEAREGLFLTVPTGVPLSPGFDPGTRIELRPDPSLALRLPGPRVYWSDWALNPVPDESGGGADVAAAVAETIAGGRTTWFGLRLGQAASAADSVRLRRLVQNGILWAAGTPLAAPAAWPDARRAALVLTLDIEDQASNALQLADMLREEDLPGTFFAVTQLVRNDPDMGERLLAVGEVGSQTSDHTPLAGLTAQDQRFRLARSWSEVAQWTGVAPRGLHPPEESFDSNTLEAWERAGGEYILANNEARSGSPEIHMTAGGPIVLLPRLLKDDYNLIVQDRVLRATSLARALVDGTSKLYAIGGLAVVAGHTQIMRSPARIEAMRTVADSARAQGDWWIARAGQVAAWWRQRAAVEITFVPHDLSSELAEGVAHADVSDVLVRAPRFEGVRGLWIDVVLPRRDEVVIPLVDGRSIDFASTGWGVSVPVGNVPAGDTRRISFLVVDEATVAPALPGA